MVLGHWWGQGGHGLLLGLLWVSLASLGGFWGLARGVLETQKGLFLHKYAYLIAVLITFSRDMAPHLPLFEDIGPDAGKCSENVTTTSECIHALV